MKKLFLLFFAVLITLSLTPGSAKAANICNESSNVDAEVNGTAEFNKDNSGKNGIVPCGRATTDIYSYRVQCIYHITNPNTGQQLRPDEINDLVGNQTFGPAANEAAVVAAVTTALGSFACSNAVTYVFQGNTITPPGNINVIVTKNTNLKCPCGLSHVFILIFNIYKFIVFKIATPLAALLMVLGGIMWVVSAGNPGLLDMGRRMFKGAIWGIVLIFGSWIIVNVVLIAIGYTGGWSGITF